MYAVEHARLMVYCTSEAEQSYLWIERLENIIRLRLLALQALTLGLM